MPKGSNLKIEHEKRKLKIEGQKFSMLTVLYEDGRSSNNCFTYTCKCECGNERKNVISAELKRGKIKSCGCANYTKRPDRKNQLKKRIHDRIKIVGECWEWQGYLNKIGYGQAKLQKKTWLAHRLSYEIFINEIPTNMLVLHKCDNKCCVNPEHLFLGTHADNTNDMCKKNRQAGHGIMTQEKVKEIRKSYPQISVVELSKKYDVSNFCILKIINNKTWKYA